MGKINKALLKAVKHGDLKKVKYLINRHGLHHSVAHGYILLLKSIKNQDNEITKLLLNEGSRVNRKRSLRVLSNAPLHLAIENGDLEIIEMLLDHGADINADNAYGLSPLVQAIRMEEEEGIVDLLLERNASFHRCVAGLNPLHAAIKDGLYEVTEELLQSGACVNVCSTARYYKAFTPLHFATDIGNLAIIKLLLQNGANVRSETLTRLTPLHLACKNGNIEIIELLLSCNADINACANNSITPLYSAVENSQRGAAKFLMDRGAKVDNESQNRKTVLYCAVKKGFTLIVEDILQYRPDINNASNKKSFIYAACRPRARWPSETDYSIIVKNLLNYGFSAEPEDINDTVLLHNAIQMGYIKIIQDLIRHGLDLASDKKENRIILHIAEQYKQYDIAKLLLAHGANANAIDKYRRTAIYYSTKNSDVEMTKILILYGANVKNSPKLLRIAIQEVCKEIVEILIESKVDIEATDQIGRTALHLTASHEFNLDMIRYDLIDPQIIINDKAEIAKMLLSIGADANANAFNLLTPLHIACDKEFTSVIEVLLEYADVNCVAKCGATPLHFAAKQSDPHVIELLIAKKANVNAKKQNGDTPLHIAARNCNRYVMETLLKYGADVHSENNKGVTPLHAAFKQPTCETVSMLLKHGSSVDGQDKHGNTLLHAAIIMSGSDIIKSLLDLGCDINTLNSKNYTVLDVAYDLRYSQLKRLSEELFCDEDDDTYVHRNETYDSNNISGFQILLLHAIMLKAANLYYGKRDLYSYLADNDFMKSHEEKCTNEIIKLKLEKIPGNNLSFYDILTKSIHSSASYARNEDIIRTFESNHYKNKFPIYASVIERNFKKATQRRPLLEKAHEYFKFYFEIPYECADQILSFLSNADLKNLRLSFET